MHRREEHLSWWHSDSGVLPSAHPQRPWTKIGVQAVALTDEGVDINDAIAEVLVFRRNLVPADTSVSGARSRDSVEMQASFQGVSEAPGWASGASPQGMYIDDGYKRLGIGIGSSLDVIDPITGDIIETISTNWQWLVRQVYLLRKVGTERWEIEVSGKVLATIGYERAADSTTTPAIAGIGSLDSAGTSRGYFDQFELGTNYSIPPQWKVDRTFNTIAPSIRNRWTEEARALTRAGLGMVQHVTEALTDLWTDLTAGRQVDTRVEFEGDRLPSQENPAWTLFTGGVFSVARERVRINTPGAAHARCEYAIPAPAVTIPTYATWTIRGRFQLRSSTPDAAGRVGPYLMLRDGNKRITAQLIRNNASPGEHYWAFTDAALTGALTMYDTYRWVVDPYQEHEVEIVSIGQAVVLLLVNGKIVGRMSYGVFPAHATRDFAVGSYGPGGAVADFRMRLFRAELRTTDIHHRTLLLQNCVERLMFVSGCETNEELQMWNEHHHGVEVARGTTVGIVMEMRKLAGCSRAELVSEETEGNWYLEETYPEVTPIYLEMEGTLLDVFVEFAHRSTNFTAQQIADLAARYLVPMSVVELQYYICVAEWMSAPTAVVGGKTRITIPDTSQFAAGDTVTIHDAANTVIETSTVDSIVSGTTLDVVLLASAYLAGSTIRKTLAVT